MILEYVEDLLFTGNSSYMIREATDTIYQNFRFKDLGSLRHFFWIEVLKSKEEILLNQK